MNMLQSLKNSPTENLFGIEKITSFFPKHSKSVINILLFSLFFWGSGEHFLQQQVLMINLETWT